MHYIERISILIFTFFNLGTRADCEDLIEKAHRMLEEAESIVSQIVSVKYDYDVSNEKLMKLKPDELAEFLIVTGF